MRHSAKLVCGAGAAIIMLAGCSGGGGGMATPAIGNAVQQDSVRTRSAPGLDPTNVIGREFPLLTAQGPREPLKAFVNSAALAKQSTTIAVSDYEKNVVRIYDPAGEELAQLDGFRHPAGMASDIKGDLYVADNANERVQIYAAGFRGRPTTLSDPGYNPSGVDSYNNGQIVAIANVDGTNLGPGNVKFFTNGQLTNTVSSPVIPYFYSCAFDAVGNLYVQGNGIDRHARVGEIIGGAHGHKVTLLKTSNALGYSSNPTGIQVTNNGQIAVGADAGRGSHKTIYTYNPPVGESLESPAFTTALLGTRQSGYFAFTKNMTSLYTADFSGELVQYAYPAGGKTLSTINVDGQPYGVAIIPAQYP